MSTIHKTKFWILLFRNLTIFSGNWVQIAKKLFIFCVFIIVIFALFTSDIQTQTVAKFSQTKAEINTSTTFSDSCTTNKYEGVLPPFGGRLGNQLFRYACAYTLARRLNTTLHLPVVEGYSILNHFKLDPNFNAISNSSEVISSARHCTQELEEQDILWRADSFLPIKGRTLTFSSFCQSQEYFKEYQDEIKTQFEPKFGPELNNPEFQNWLNKLKDSGDSSVAIHIRRGDYLASPDFVTRISFYLKGMDMMTRLLAPKNLTFFVFSDSLELVKYETKGTPLNNFRVQWVSNSSLTNVQEFHLMRNCSHIIMSNSSFSWWAAYLNKNKSKIIIAPAFSEKIIAKFPSFTKFKDFKYFIYNSLYYPKEWIVLSNY